MTNVRFAHQDAHLITTGGMDKCVFVWKTDLLEEARERQVMNGPAIGQPDSLEGGVEASDMDLFDYNSLKFEAPSGGDEFMAVKPFRDSLVAPTMWVDSNQTNQLPDATLELAFVYGYRAHDCRNNICLGENATQIVYHVACVGIVYDSVQHRQVRRVNFDDACIRDV